MDKFYKLDYRHPTRVGYEELSIVFFSSLDKVREIINDRMLQPGFLCQHMSAVHPEQKMYRMLQYRFLSGWKRLLC